MAHTPASSHGGGTFNGGTITAPLVIDLQAHADATALKIVGVPGGGADLIEVQDGATDTVMEVLNLAGHGGGMIINSFVNTAEALVASHQGTAPAVDILAADASGPTLSAISKGGYIVTQVHAAPADADLAAGQCALWFDQTNGAGATKLMVKGKSADGTVKTATILLA